MAITKAKFSPLSNMQEIVDVKSGYYIDSDKTNQKLDQKFERILSESIGDTNGGKIDEIMTASNKVTSSIAETSYISYVIYGVNSCALPTDSSINLSYASMISGIGNINGDGIADLMISTYSTLNAPGDVYYIYGGAFASFYIASSGYLAFTVFDLDYIESAVDFWDFNFDFYFTEFGLIGLFLLNQIQAEANTEMQELENFEVHTEEEALLGTALEARNLDVLVGVEMETLPNQVESESSSEEYDLVTTYIPPFSQNDLFPLAQSEVEANTEMQELESSEIRTGGQIVTEALEVRNSDILRRVEMEISANQMGGGGSSAAHENTVLVGENSGDDGIIDSSTESTFSDFVHDNYGEF